MTHNFQKNNFGGDFYCIFVCFGARNRDYGDFFVETVKKFEAQIRNLRKKLGRNIWAPKFFIEIENFGS